MTVHQLRKLGYKVKVWHTRNGSYDYLEQFDPRGGMTEVEVYDMNAQQSYLGIAQCSDKDNYNKKLGVKIALGRALKKMGM